MSATYLDESRAAAAAVTGSKNPRWNRRGKTTTKAGYVLVRVGFGRSATGWAPEHWVVMEKRLGRRLDPEEVVHHVNGVRDDNRSENLWLWPDGSSHAIWHCMQRNGRDLFVDMPATRLAVAR